MNFSVKANLLNGQFSISHTLNCSDFKPALVTTSLIDKIISIFLSIIRLKQLCNMYNYFMYYYIGRWYR